MTVNDLSQIFLEGEVFANVLRRGKTAIILPEIGSSSGAIGLVVTRLKVGKSQRAYIRDAELLGPVLSDGAGENCSAPAIVSETRLVDRRRTNRPRLGKHDVALIDRDRHCAPVVFAPCNFG